MTDFNRSPTLSLRRTGTALTGSHPSKPAAPAVTRKGVSPAGITGGTAGGLKGGASGGAQAASERTLDSTALLQGRSHVSIVHNGETYQLRATRLGKLILTK
ncbi:hemin uptake protein HemP [Paraburkholderia silviterrae]|uniref:Hemin uptake protein HemP n=1 Tax=Paraburkholderia silviterrae TaxID=2528715 RepID=A0A4R5MET4_9BURK|nr:hemin uptake protein HemP [Paraburkholderia silviterrae]TDG25642.1 hemin uptake protein HemP [Paraburkholderia silviterrae]